MRCGASSTRACSCPAASAAPGVQLPGDNLHHRPRHTCTLVGECDLGCNEGAKNSLDYSYLSLFKGVIRTCCEAISIGRCAGGWEVEYRQHEQAREHVL